MARVRKKVNKPTAPKVTPWTIARDSAKGLVADCRRLTGESTRISMVLRDPVVHAQFNSAEISGLESDAKTALNLLEQYNEGCIELQDIHDKVVAAGPCSEPEMAFMNVGMMANHIATNYQDGVLPAIERVLEYASVAANRASAPEETEAPVDE